MIIITSRNRTGLSPLPPIPEEDLRLAPEEELPFRQRLIRELNDRYGPIPKHLRTEEDNYQRAILRNRIDASRKRCPMTAQQEEETRQIFKELDDEACGRSSK